MSSPYPLRLSDELVARIQKAAKAKELPFAATCRLLMVERLDELEALGPGYQPKVQGQTNCFNRPATPEALR